MSEECANNIDEICNVLFQNKNNVEDYIKGEIG